MAKLSDLAGSRPKVYNLKDTDTLKDKTILISHVNLHNGGEFGLFLVMNCKVMSAAGTWGEEIVLTTGAEDIVQRIVPLVDKINNGLEIEAVLTKIGRKWLID